MQIINKVKDRQEVMKINLLGKNTQEVRKE